jgi:ABC-type thiamine transport system ATPase subunit
MTRDKALEVLDALLAKSSLDQELREALSTLIDEVVVNSRKVSLLTKALAEAEDRVAALQLDLGVKEGRVTAQGPKGDAAVVVVGVSAVGGSMG